MERTQPTTEPNKDKRYILKSIIGFISVAVIGSISAIFIPAFAGTPPKPMALFSVTLWMGILFSLIWKYRDKRKLIGFILGSFVGLVLSFSASFISGYVQAGTRAINKTIESTNKDLPKMINKETRLERISVNQKTRDYYYNLTLINFSLSELNTNILDENYKKSIKPFMCRKKELQMFLKEKYSINLIYNDKTGKKVRHYKIKPGDC